MGKETKKETDFWGNEKEVHYEDGKKVGETRYRETFWGNKVQDHYNSSGEKTGETRREEGLFSDKAVHYDSEGKKTGYTKNDETFFGNKIQRHYDPSGHEVGKSHYEEGFFGGHKKVHEGEYFKGGGEGGGGSGAYGSSYGDSSPASGLGLLLGVLVCAAIGIGLIISVFQGSGDKGRPAQPDNQVNTAQTTGPVTPLPLQTGRYVQGGAVSHEYFQERLRISVPYVDVRDDSLIVHLEFKNDSDVPAKYLVGNGLRDDSSMVKSYDLPEIEDQFGNKYPVQLPTLRGEIEKYSFVDDLFAWGGRLTNKYRIPVGETCEAYMVFPKPKDTNYAKLHLAGVNGWIFSRTMDIQLTNSTPLDDKVVSSAETTTPIPQNHDEPTIPPEPIQPAMPERQESQPVVSLHGEVKEIKCLAPLPPSNYIVVVDKNRAVKNWGIFFSVNGSEYRDLSRAGNVRTREWATICIMNRNREQTYFEVDVFD